MEYSLEFFSQPYSFQSRVKHSYWPSDPLRCIENALRLLQRTLFLMAEEVEAAAPLPADQFRYSGRVTADHQREPLGRMHDKVVYFFYPDVGTPALMSHSGGCP